MESPASTIDDDGFLNEALTILDNLADEHFSLKLEQDSDATTVAVGDFLDAAIETFNDDVYPENTAKAHKQSTTRAGNQSNSILVDADAAAAIHPQGRRRIRMREQLIQLRSVVKKLETHLETLQCPDSSRFEDAMQSGNGTIAWRNIALEQFQARREAELHNAQLRDKLLASIQLSDRVKNLLRLQYSVSTASTTR